MSGQMWTPANKYGLPSENDIPRAREAIKQLKAEIELASLRVAEAQRYLDGLTDNLREREAWLAPIRRIPFDILSLIFTMASKMDWKTPMSLAGVSRVWRECILATPRAWSFIDIKQRDALRQLTLFLERSGNSLFHVSLDKCSGNQEYSAVSQMAKRIECLSLPAFSLDLPFTAFPLLTRLYLRDQRSGEDLLQLNTSRFPNLRKLRYENSTPFPLGAPIVDLNFPTISTLDLTMDDGRALFHILQKCSQTLENLSIFFLSWTHLVQDYTIALPRLRRLVFMDTRKASRMTTLFLITPSLKYLSVRVSRDAEQLPLQMDLGLLTHVRILGDECTQLSVFRSAKVLQLRIGIRRLIAFLGDLSNNQSVCPLLETLELSSTSGQDGSEILDELVSTLNKQSGRRVRVSIPPTWGQTLPGNDICETGLPCGIEDD
ncbi:hypothetical protein M408DRAFT_24833 [Serendipita vermifera MAFF 305830]|uniref:F-box domain-containing protein n=1 Tax=Serendipita vermifera MAFF 305830 TaxID=933852 RepID=A0A0C2XDF8_SERVB|nr:hypothetical protein M408DRAFT_24833 [Serendipita vermifera MAFF 305830]